MSTVASWLAERGERAFEAFVARSDDRRLERTLGTNPGLRVIFGAMAQRFDPSRAEGFEGAIQYELTDAGGGIKPWVLEIHGHRARARPGRGERPAVTLSVGLSDFLRIAGRDLEPGKALMLGAMRVEGDFGVLARLSEMFGRPSGY
jgi:putative sterol carrier protein